MPTPTNPKLYEAVKKKIMKSYKKNSGFASGAIVKEYKRQGGKYKEDGEPKKLKRWFKEEWINVNPLLGITNEDAYPTFRPTIKVNKETPTIVSNISKEELKKQYALKQKFKGEQNLPTFKPIKKGKGLKADTFRALLESSYEGGDAGGFTMDRQLSTKTSKVYTHPSGQVVVAHRGTAGALDWGNNAVYAMGGDLAYKLTPRYREAKKVQQNAEKKYGAKNITTIGHSQGGLQAQLLGGNTKEIITLNKATRPQEFLFGSSKKKNQYDVRASGDAVSAFRNPFQRAGDETIQSKANPLAQHSTDILESKEEEILGNKTFYGNGIRKKGKGLKGDELIALLNASYELMGEGGEGEVYGWRKDEKLSTDTTKVFFRDKGEQVVVAHRGTIGDDPDWYNNAVFAVGSTPSTGIFFSLKYELNKSI